MTATETVVAAGALVPRKVKGQVEVLVVHRPRYDDWSWPKGKLDPDEPAPVAAVREVAEETGLDVRLGPPLPDQRYPVPNGVDREKLVHYWVGRLVGGDDVDSFPPTAEIDQVQWVRVDEAEHLLTHARDRALLSDLERLRKKTRTLVVLRHAKARSRGSWRGSDGKRPLNPLGEMQADRLVAVLGAYGVERLVSSSSVRCWATLAPYADVADLDVEVTDTLSEEDTDADEVMAEVRRLVREDRPVALCTHRPVLPIVFRALGLTGHPDVPSLVPGAFVVVHHRHRRPAAVEHHEIPSGR